MNKLNFLGVLTFIAFLPNMASAQAGPIDTESSMVAQTDSKEEIQNYFYDDTYFSKDVTTIIPGYSDYYGFSKVKNEII